MPRSVRPKARKLPAEHICGEESGLLEVMLSLPRAARLPPEPLLRIAAAGPGEG